MGGGGKRLEDVLPVGAMMEDAYNDQLVIEFKSRG